MEATGLLLPGNAINKMHASMTDRGATGGFGFAYRKYRRQQKQHEPSGNAEAIHE
jgi:hypothetical protein